MRTSEKTTRLVAMVLLVALLAVCAGARAGAESLWDQRRPSSAHLFTDNLASDIGDSLTVNIAEQSAFEMDSSRGLSKTTASGGSLNVDTPLAEVSIPSGSLTQQSSRTFDGSLDYNGSRSFADSITVSVVDRLPNGNLVVAGRSHREIAGETVDTVLTGIVKPEDISGANTVNSTRVAYLNVFYEPAGPSESYVRDGFMNRILNFIWPF